MGQKVNPTGFRVGIMENWRSRWYANKKDFSRYLLEDFNTRKYVLTEYEYASEVIGKSFIPRVDIERTREKVNIILFTSRPGLIIGKKGANVDKLKENLAKYVSDREISLDIKEIAQPEANAQLVAQNIAEQLEKRANFRRTMKKAIEAARTCGVLGIKVQVGGRLSGAEMARSEWNVEGTIPLQTLNAHIEFGFAEAITTYGKIGIKVWIYLGNYGEEVIGNATDAKKGKVSKKPARKY